MCLLGFDRGLIGRAATRRVLEAVAEEGGSVRPAALKQALSGYPLENYRFEELFDLVARSSLLKKRPPTGSSR